MSLPGSYSERDHQLAVGFAPTDAFLGGRPRWPVRLDIEIPDGVPRRIAEGYRHYSRPSDQIPKISRHDSGLYKLIYLVRRSLPDNAIVRIYDDQQKFIPRRLRFPIPAPEQVWKDTKPRAIRRQRPLLFPSNAYPIAEHSMGLRGRIVRNGKPMPWAWVDAFFLIQTGTEENPQFLRRGNIGRAISDEHGEFLLILNPLSTLDLGVPDLLSPVWVNVVINGPTPVPVEPENNLDPMWAVPIEILPDAGLPDPALNSDYVPDTYATDLGAAANRNIAFQPGRLLTGIDVADFVFGLP